MKILTEPQAKHISELSALRLADYIQKAGLKTFVLGISGGLDSAVMAAIGLSAIEILRQRGYECGYDYTYIDIESKSYDLVRAKALADNLGFTLRQINLTEWYLRCPFRTVDPSTKADRVYNGNIKCRERMVYLFGQAGKLKGLVLDTDDLSEYLMGFWTINGDVGNVKVIQELTKDEVRDLGEYMKKIPDIILKSAPGDGLGITTGNQAADQLRIEYLKIDYLMSQLIRYGFDYNGSKEQLEDERYMWLFKIISAEVGEPVENLIHVASQAIYTGFKRINGDGIANLLPSRSEMGLPELGSVDFKIHYLAAIKKD